MLHIGGFFEKYLHKHTAAKNKKEIVLKEIERVIGKTLIPEEWDIQGVSVVSTAPSYIKQAVFFKRTEIIKAFQQHKETERITQIQ